MNVFVDGKFLCSFDNSNWTEENGRVPWVDIGREHVNHYYEIEAAREWLYGSSNVCRRRSDEGTLG